MEEIRGKTLKEWKEYCKSDNVPIKTMKYIACLEERIEVLTIPDVVVPKGTCCLNPQRISHVTVDGITHSTCENCKKEIV